jgi:hypothetical protein
MRRVAEAGDRLRIPTEEPVVAIWAGWTPWLFAPGRLSNEQEGE